MMKFVISLLNIILLGALGIAAVLVIRSAIFHISEIPGKRIHIPAVVFFFWGYVLEYFYLYMAEYYWGFPMPPV